MSRSSLLVCLLLLGTLLPLCAGELLISSYWQDSCATASGGTRLPTDGSCAPLQSEDAKLDVEFARAAYARASCDASHGIVLYYEDADCNLLVGGRKQPVDGCFDSMTMQCTDDGSVPHPTWPAPGFVSYGPCDESNGARHLIHPGLCEETQSVVTPSLKSRMVACDLDGTAKQFVYTDSTCGRNALFTAGQLPANQCVDDQLVTCPDPANLAPPQADSTFPSAQDGFAVNTTACASADACSDISCKRMAIRLGRCQPMPESVDDVGLRSMAFYCSAAKDSVVSAVYGDTQCGGTAQFGIVLSKSGTCQTGKIECPANASNAPQFLGGYSIFTDAQCTDAMFGITMNPGQCVRMGGGESYVLDCSGAQPKLSTYHSNDCSGAADDVFSVPANTCLVPGMDGEPPADMPDMPFQPPRVQLYCTPSNNPPDNNPPDNNPPDNNPPDNNPPDNNPPDNNPPDNNPPDNNPPDNNPPDNNPPDNNPPDNNPPDNNPPDNNPPGQGGNVVGDNAASSQQVSLLSVLAALLMAAWLRQA